MSTREVITPEMGKALSDTVVGLTLPLSINWKRGVIDCTEVKKRSLSQNAIFHKWMQELADQSGDMDAHDMKGVCHREFGLPIRLRSDQFAWIWNRTGAKLNYEKQCSLLASGVLNISSGMTTAELKEYLDTVQRHFLGKGYTLTNPDDRPLSMKET